MQGRHPQSAPPTTCQAAHDFLYHALVSAVGALQLASGLSSVSFFAFFFPVDQKHEQHQQPLRGLVRVSVCVSACVCVWEPTQTLSSWHCYYREVHSLRRIDTDMRFRLHGSVWAASDELQWVMCLRAHVVRATGQYLCIGSVSFKRLRVICEHHRATPRQLRFELSCFFFRNVFFLPQFHHL